MKFIRPIIQQALRGGRGLGTYHKLRVVNPGHVSPRREVPDRIKKPDYITTGMNPRHSVTIDIKTADDIEKLRLTCKMARIILNKVEQFIKPGITTDDIDLLVHEECITHNCYPSPLLYKGFPKSVCTSVNNVLVHGIPDDGPLQEGDIINVDITVYHGGFHGDTNATFPVGHIDEASKRLLEVGKESLHQGISVCKPGAKFYEIGRAISNYADSLGYTVVPGITGHGIGSYFHGPPDIFHVDYITEESSLEMKPGMTFTIEPCITSGSGEYILLDDGWTIVAKDNAPSCQFEHTVLITNSGVEILTGFYMNYESI